jgi:hypothetical protein
VHFVCALLATGTGIDFSTAHYLVDPPSLQDSRIYPRSGFQTNRGYSPFSIPTGQSDLRLLVSTFRVYWRAFVNFGAR